MHRGQSLLSFVVLVAVTSISAQAACGGGGFKPSKGSPKKGDVVYVSSPTTVQAGAQVSTQTTRSGAQLSSQPVQQTVYRNPKLDGAQRDIDKAQEKLDRCVGDCEKERRKLDEAKAKYARKAAEV